MAFIEYDVSIDPEKPQINFSIAMTPKKLTCKFESIGDFSLSVQPSTGTIVGGAIVGSILGLFGGPAGALLGGGAGVGTVYAVGDLIKKGLTDGITSALPGQSVDVPFGETLGYQLKIQNVDVNVGLDTVNLSTFNGMLMATGSVTVK